MPCSMILYSGVKGCAYSKVDSTGSAYRVINKEIVCISGLICLMIFMSQERDIYGDVLYLIQCCVRTGMSGDLQTSSI